MNQKKINKFENIVENKRVLFITTKNLDYIRNSQEIKLLREISSDLKIIGSKEKSYVKRLLKVYWQLLTEKIQEIDVIFIGFAPQLILPFFKRKLKKKTVIIDFFISMYDTFVCDRKKVGAKSVLGRLFHFLDEITLKEADYVISDTVAHGDFFSQEFNVLREKIETLYLEADTSIYYPREAAKVREHWENQYVILYFGSILPLQGVDIVMEAIDRIKDDKRLRFVIIGPIEKKLKKTEADNIEYIEWLPQETLAEYIAGADLCLAGHFSASIEKANRTIPGKAYIYAAMDKKMILGNSIANRELFEETDNEFFVELGNAEKLAEKILEIVQNNLKQKEG